MATILLKKRSLPLSSEPKKSRVSRLRHFSNPFFVLGLGLSFIFLLSFLYLSQFQHISAQGVIINELQSQRNELIIENEVWNMRIARLKSLDVIQHQEVVQKMREISPEEVQFINLDQWEEQQKKSLKPAGSP